MKNMKTSEIYKEVDCFVVILFFLGMALAFTCMCVNTERVAQDAFGLVNADKCSMLHYLAMAVLDFLLVVYLFKLSISLKIAGYRSIVLVFFITAGASSFFIMVTPLFRFLIQLGCFLTVIMAMYYANTGKPGWAFWWWTVSIVFSPMHLFFVPVLFMLIDAREKEQDVEFSFDKWIEKRLYWLLPGGMIALCHIMLSFLGIGFKIQEIHETNMKENLESLLHMPKMNENGMLSFDFFENMNFFVSSPIIIVALIGLVFAHVKKDKNTVFVGWWIVFASVMYILFISSYANLESWFYVNPYVMNLLPYYYLLLCMVIGKNKLGTTFCIPFLVFGVGLNFCGVFLAAVVW